MANRPSLSRAVLAPGNAEDVKRFGTQLREMFPKSSFRYFPREEPISDGRKRLSEPPDRFFAFSMINPLDEHRSFSLVVDKPGKSVQLEEHFILAASILSDGKLLPLVFPTRNSHDRNGKLVTQVSARLTPEDSEPGQVEMKGSALVDILFTRAKEIASFLKDHTGGLGLMGWLDMGETSQSRGFDIGIRTLADTPIVVGPMRLDDEPDARGGLDVRLRSIADTPHVVDMTPREPILPASRLEPDTPHFPIQKIERCFLAAAQRKAKKSADERYPITIPEEDPRLSRIQAFVADLDGDLDRSTRIIW